MTFFACLAVVPALQAQTATWIERTPAVRPERRRLHTLTYDSVRGQVVLFGGTIGTSRVPGPLWIWDGSNWTEPVLPDAPARRTEHAAAFDEARGETVIFGGSTQFGATDHTLTWNGSVLTQRTPPLSPSPRVSSAMAYDAERRHIVLFGGQYGPAFSETWIWNGTTWQLKTPANSPPARVGHAMTWDPVRKVVLLHGGFVPELGKLVNDTWAWDGTNWTQYSPALSPSARSLHAMTYVPTLERTVLYGGGRLSGDSGMADMWGWDGTNWTQITPPQNPGLLKGAAMDFDATRQELVMFGGYNAVLNMDISETWVYTAGSHGQTVLTLAPSSLELLRLRPGPEPSVPPIAVTAASATPFTVSVSTTDGHIWLKASPGSGVTPSTILATLDTSMLSHGVYYGVITISSPGAVNSPQSVHVTLTVRRTRPTKPPPIPAGVQLTGKWHERIPTPNSDRTIDPDRSGSVPKSCRPCLGIPL